MDNSKSYVLDSRAGSQQLVDANGTRVKKFYGSISGRAKFMDRQSLANKTGDQRFAAKIPPGTKVNMEMLPLILN